MDKFEFATKVFASFQKGVMVTAQNLTLNNGSDDAERNRMYTIVSEHIQILGETTRKALSAVGHLHPGEQMAKHHIEDVMGEFGWLSAATHRKEEAPYLLPSINIIMHDLQELLRAVPVYDAAMALRAVKHS